MDLVNTAVVIRGLPSQGSTDLDALRLLFATECEVARFCCLDNNIVVAILSDATRIENVIRALHHTRFEGQYPLQLSRLQPGEAETVHQILGSLSDNKAETEIPKHETQTSVETGDEPVLALLQIINSLGPSEREQIISSLVGSRTPSRKPRNVALGGVQTEGSQKPSHSTPKAVKKENDSHATGCQNVTMLVDSEAISIPKLSIFSGSLTATGEPKQGETSYNQFRYQVRCLVREGKFSNEAIMRAVRRATKGAAADILLTMGETVTPAQMLEKFEVIYGNVLTKEQALEAIYAAQQRTDEMVAGWASRLEKLAAEAIDKGAITQRAAQEVTRSKFWTGLRLDGVKQQTRHRFDDLACSFDALVTACRRVEAEQRLSSQSGSAPPDRTRAAVSQQVSRDPTDEKLNQIIKMVKGLGPHAEDGRMISGSGGIHTQQVGAQNQQQFSERWTNQHGGYYVGVEPYSGPIDNISVQESSCPMMFQQTIPGRNPTVGVQPTPYIGRFPYPTGETGQVRGTPWYGSPDTSYVQQTGRPSNPRGTAPQAGLGHGTYRNAAPQPQPWSGFAGAHPNQVRQGNMNYGPGYSTQGQRSRSCFRCGMEGHFKRDCPWNLNM